MEWARCREWFAWDGALLDLYVAPTTHDDWQRLLDALRAGGWSWRFAVDGVARATLPAAAVAVFTRRAEERPLLTIDPGGLNLNAHFFTSEEIEFDLDPRAIDGEAQFAHLLAFVDFVSDALGREVLLTPENCPQRPLWRFAARRGGGARR